MGRESCYDHILKGQRNKRALLLRAHLDCTWGEFATLQRVLGKHKWPLWLPQEGGQSLQTLPAKGGQDSLWEVSKNQGREARSSKKQFARRLGGLSSEIDF